MSQGFKDKEELKNPHDEKENPDDDNFDVLNLPPRKKVHQQGSKKNNGRVSNFWIRLLFIIFIVLIAVILSYQYWDEWFGSSVFNSNVIEDQTPYHQKITVER
ncbi:hypothetical protein [Halobacillus litoralis]|uniref:hypothetical protein n=1 Tax=Halobacillus litoralis TaxID=45668 RepID=UPI001CFD57C9|nr:hypothetical protein [Halobacillus litoralis]